MQRETTVADRATVMMGDDRETQDGWKTRKREKMNYDSIKLFKLIWVKIKPVHI